MRKTIFKSLILLSAIFQIAMAQNTERRNMNQDSTSLVPSGMATVPTNQTFTSTYSTVMGACGADNGKTLSSAPTNLCSAGTPSTVYTNGNSFAWSCTGNYGTASTVSCGATKSNYITVTINACTWSNKINPWPSFFTLVAKVPYYQTGSNGYLTPGTYQYGDFGSQMKAQWGVMNTNTVATQFSVTSFSVSDIPSNITFTPSINVINGWNKNAGFVTCQ